MIAAGTRVFNTKTGHKAKLIPAHQSKAIPNERGQQYLLRHSSANISPNPMTRDELKAEGWVIRGEDNPAVD